jgi:hemoglobin-like flavoprotein
MTGDANPGTPTSASPAPFDAEALRVIRSSAIRLARFEAEFARRLHQDIVALSPNVAVSMTEAGRPFCVRMARALIWVALSDQPPSVMADVLRQVGSDNYHEGLRDVEYVSVAHALLRAIRDLTESEWVTSMGSAWISCFMWMQPHLLAGARQAAAEPETQAPSEEPPQPTPEAAPEVPPKVAHARQPSQNGTRSASHDSPSPPATTDDVDDDDDEVGYGQIMVSMTLNPRRDRLPDR